MKIFLGYRKGHAIQSNGINPAKQKPLRERFSHVTSVTADHTAQRFLPDKKINDGQAAVGSEEQNKLFRPGEPIYFSFSSRSSRISCFRLPRPGLASFYPVATGVTGIVFLGTIPL